MTSKISVRIEISSNERLVPPTQPVILLRDVPFPLIGICLILRRKHTPPDETACIRLLGPLSINANPGLLVLSNGNESCYK